MYGAFRNCENCIKMRRQKDLLYKLRALFEKAIWKSCEAGALSIELKSQVTTLTEHAKDK